MKGSPIDVQKKIQSYNIDVERNKKRFEMFDKKTIRKVLALNAFFERYVFSYDKSYSRNYVYYDTAEQDLGRSGISIFKELREGKCELFIARSSVEGQSKILERLNGRKYSIPIGPTESPIKKMSFLSEHFKDMFAYAVEFDPEYLLRRLQTAYTIKTETMEYRVSNGFGLKARIAFDHDEYFNAYTGRKNSAELMTLYQLSGEQTDEAFFDLISKLERYCKELSPAPDHKTTVLLAKTKEITKVDKQTAKREKKEQDKADKW